MQEHIHINETTGLVFRREAGKLVAVLTKIFGVHNLQLAEDVVQDTLLRALETWRLQGIPQHPTGWLFRVAKNKAIDIIRRNRQQAVYAAAIDPLLHSEYSLTTVIDNLLCENHITDDQLRMMFTCCHPGLSIEAQVALILKTLCGLSVAEIAKAFITSVDTVEKRLYRARLLFREQKIAFEIPDNTQLKERLDGVLAAIYFIFNEGYLAASHSSLIRQDLLQESIRLATLLTVHPQTKDPRVPALLALICFNSSRSAARLDGNGAMLLLHEQDRRRWDQALISRGIAYLNAATDCDTVSTYHLQAMIACEHCCAKDFAATNWNNILSCYNLLYQINPSPVIALNHAIALGEQYGPAAAIAAIHAIPGQEVLEKYYLYHATLGEYHHRMGEAAIAVRYLRKAISLTQSAAEATLLEAKIKNIESLPQKHSNE